jgi:hypothetical protein
LTKKCLYASVVISSFRQNKEDEMASKEELIERFRRIVTDGSLVDGNRIRSTSENRDGSLTIDTGRGSLRVKIEKRKNETSQPRAD